MLRARRTVLGLLLVFTTALGVADARRGASGAAEDAVTGEAPGLVFRLSEGTETGEAPAARGAPAGGAASRRRRAPRARPPAAPRRRASRGALRAPRGLGAPAARRAHRARGLPARGGGPAAGGRAGGPARGAAPDARGRRASRAPPLDHLLAAHGGARLARGARARGGPRAALSPAARRVALGGHADARLRARGPLPDGDRLPRRGAGRARGARPAGRWRTPSPGRSRRPRRVSWRATRSPARRGATR